MAGLQGFRPRNSSSSMTSNRGLGEGSAGGAGAPPCWGYTDTGLKLGVSTSVLSPELGFVGDVASFPGRSADMERK